MSRWGDLWPFVHKARLDAAEREVAAVRAELANARDLHTAYRDAERARFDDVFSRYHELKVAGAEKPAPLVAMPPREPDPVTQAIIARAGNHPWLRQYYGQRVAERRANGDDEQTIAQAILMGSQPSEDEGVPGMA